jgi:aminoglycoside phosphotransferase (APT) family kinase protein
MARLLRPAASLTPDARPTCPGLPAGRRTEPTRPRANPACAHEVADALRQYLSGHLGTSALAYREEPAEFADGWEAYSYHFELRAAPGLPPAFARPLVARIYSSPEGLPRASHEFAVQRHVRDLGYPVAEPILLEPDPSWFGGPFSFMEYLPGRTLLRDMLERPWRLWHGPVEMADAQAALHRLPTHGFPAPAGPFLARHFYEMIEVIRTYDLDGLRPGFHWLFAHRPRVQRPPCIVHLDFHPMNLLVEEGRPHALLDWSDADLGDPVADVGTTAMLIECFTPKVSSTWHRFLVAIGRATLLRRYLRIYRRRLGLDRPTLAYYRAWAAFRRLCRYGHWLAAGPQATGGKPSSSEHLTEEHIATFRRYFTRWTGVPVRL